MFDRQNWTINGEKIRLGWAMPLDWSHINKATHISSMFMRKPDIVYLDTNQSGDIAEKREGQCEGAMKSGCTHVALLDGDMVYYPTMLEDMFAEMDRGGAELVGGLCYRGSPPYDPVIVHPTEEGKTLQPFKDFQFGDVVEAGGTGGACLLVKREVFETLKQPWFRIAIEKKLQDGVEIIIKRGEDIYFTRRAVRAGFKLHILTKEDIGHMREFQVDRSFWMIFGIMNNLGSWEKIAQLLVKSQDKDWVERELGDWR